MGFEVITHPEAQDEIDEAMGYLEERSLWASKKLMAEYDEHVAKILGSPLSFRRTYCEYRRINLKKFQFHIIYRVLDRTIFIIAFAHDKRHPDYWKSRITD